MKYSVIIISTAFVFMSVTIKMWFVPIKACPAGTYGVNCAEECVCGENAKCDPVTGDCLCSAGWFGDQCTKGKY